MKHILTLAEEKTQEENNNNEHLVIEDKGVRPLLKLLNNENGINTYICDNCERVSNVPSENLNGILICPFCDIINIFNTAGLIYDKSFCFECFDFYGKDELECDKKYKFDFDELIYNLANKKTLDLKQQELLSRYFIFSRRGEYEQARNTLFFFICYTYFNKEDNETYEEIITFDDLDVFVKKYLK